jgi:regulator of replication initiation timing
MEENILDIYKHLQKMSGFQTQIIEEIALLKQEVQSIKRIITEGLIEDTQIRGQADKLFSAVMELQESQPNVLAHQLVDRERLQ